MTQPGLMAAALVVDGWWSTACGGCAGTGRFEMPDGERVLCWECKGMAWVPAVLAARPAGAPSRR